MLNGSSYLALITNSQNSVHSRLNTQSLNWYHQKIIIQSETSDEDIRSLLKNPSTKTWNTLNSRHEAKHFHAWRIWDSNDHLHRWSLKLMKIYSHSIKNKRTHENHIRWCILPSFCGCSCCCIQWVAFRRPLLLWLLIYDDEGSVYTWHSVESLQHGVVWWEALLASKLWYVVCTVVDNRSSWWCCEGGLLFLTCLSHIIFLRIERYPSKMRFQKDTRHKMIFEWKGTSNFPPTRKELTVWNWESDRVQLY